MAKAESTPIELRFGVLAVEQPDGSFLATRIGRFDKGPREMSETLTAGQYNTSKKANRLVRKGNVEKVGLLLGDCKRSGGKAIVITDKLVLMARLKEIGGRYAAVKLRNEQRFHIYSLSIENDTREIFKSHTPREVKLFLESEERKKLEEQANLIPEVTY